MARAVPHIHFVLDPRATRWPDIDSLVEADIERMPSRFVGGRNSWIAQGFVRLRASIEARGWHASAGPGFPDGAICIAHRDDVNRFAVRAHRSFLVVVRADRAPARACDIAIAQNGLALERHERFLPLWPQPGLIPRDDTRGRRIERLAYRGRISSVPSWFRDAEFLAALRLRGIEFEPSSREWEDYRHVDVAIAARDELAEVLKRKPATKLYNAWLAGVPLLASPEPAYEELRRKPVDYFRIRSAADVLAALDLLRAYPRVYDAMVENGRARSLGFTVDALRERWMALLEREIVPACLRASHGRASRRAWFLRAMASQKALSRAHRLRCSAQALGRSAQRLAQSLRDRMRGSPSPGEAKAAGATRKSIAG